MPLLRNEDMTFFHREATTVEVTRRSALEGLPWLGLEASLVELLLLPGHEFWRAELQGIVSLEPCDSEACVFLGDQKARVEG